MFAVGLCPTCCSVYFEIHLVAASRRAKPDGEQHSKLINWCYTQRLAGVPLGKPALARGRVQVAIERLTRELLWQ